MTLHQQWNTDAQQGKILVGRQKNTSFKIKSLLFTSYWQAPTVHTEVDEIKLNIKKQKSEVDCFALRLDLPYKSSSGLFCCIVVSDLIMLMYPAGSI